MNLKFEKVNFINSKVQEYKKEGYSCGTASLKALAEAYGISLCLELEYQSMFFSNGGYVKDRCAFFQSAAVIIGFWFGRIDSSVKRDNCREAMEILSETFSRNLGGYLCKNMEKCSDFQNEEYIELLSYTVVEALESILKKIV